MIRSKIVSTINNLKGEAGHKKVLEVYNAQKPLPRGYKLQAEDPWCASTVSAVFLMNGCSDFSECSCPVMVKKAKDLGIWVENDAYVPKVGDIVQYDWQDNGKGDNVGEPDHVGIIIKVDGDKFTVREGNKGGTIGNRTLEVNGKYIRGFIIPHFEDDSDEKEEEATNSPSEEEKAEETAENEVKSPYIVGKTYTVSVRTALNVRKGAGKGYGLVGYAGLTDDGKKHAYPNGALKNGTRVTVEEVKVISPTDIWVKIPSGWICAVDGNKKFVI